MKEIIGRDLYVDGDVLPRADDFDGIEEYREQAPTVDADILGFALRSAAIRQKKLKIAEEMNGHLTDDEEDLRAALEDRESFESSSTMPQELQKLIDEVNAKVDEMKSWGAHESRIDSVVGKVWHQGIIRLRFSGVDVSMMPNLFSDFKDTNPEDDIESADIIDLKANSRAEAREYRIQRIMDTRGIPRSDAERMV